MKLVFDLPMRHQNMNSTVMVFKRAEEQDRVYSQIRSWLAQHPEVVYHVRRGAGCVEMEFEDAHYYTVFALSDVRVSYRIEP